ncbi:MAG: penicillin acylase family protein [Myxococcaceae bacterium]|nr:MAG: penicillin acylase family protein [Myxococcaceae bacterium]
MRHRRAALIAAALLPVTACLGCSADPSPAAADAATDRPRVGAPVVTPARCSRLEPLEPGADAPTVRLSAPVTITRDAMGIPHIEGQTDEDVMYAAGYTQAVDRMFQMDLVRRTARGRSAAVLGRDKLAQDQLIRLMAVPHWGRESARRVAREHPETHRLITAWVAGVNRRVDEINRGDVPRPPGFRATEFDFAPERWTTDDPYVIGRLQLFRNANQLDYDILATINRRYVPGAAALPLITPVGGGFIVPPDERPPAAQARRAPRDAGRRLAGFIDAMRPFARGASNNWGVAGRHSANGRPIIAGDPHQPYQSPSVFWAHHMRSAAPGGLDVVGFAFAGAPFVNLGHNRHVAWTATTAYPDTMDLFDVTVGDGTVLLGGVELPVATCAEHIAVRGAAPVEYAIEDVPGVGVLLPATLAPLPLVEADHRVLFRWTGFRATEEADVFHAFNRAVDVAGFDAAVRRMEIGSFNFIFADARDVAFRSRVLVPDRGAPRDLGAPFALLDGADPRAQWTGRLLGDDRQPSSRGGARGFLCSANNDPFGFTANGRVDDDPWYYGAWFDPGTRAARIERELGRLTAAGGVTVAQMQRLQLDTYNTLADDIVPVLSAAMGRLGADPALAAYRGDERLAALHAQLTAWDRRMDRGAAAPVVYEAFQHFFARQVLADDLDVMFDAVISREPVYIMKMLALVVTGRSPMTAQYLQQGRDVLALRALAQTRDWLTARFGGTDAARYTWGSFHTSRPQTLFSPEGPFAVAAAPSDGSIGTVNVAQGQFFNGAAVRDTMESHNAPGYRMVVGFDADGTPRATLNFPRGNSGDPASPDYANAQPDWDTGTYRPLPFDRPSIDAAMRDRTTLMP